jgi:hypothetical protein
MAGRKWRSLSGFARTQMEDAAMAPAASAGDGSVPVKRKSSPAASGISALLQAKAQKNFCRMLRIVRRRTVSALTTP